jgi:hypothetical protein
MSLELYRTRLYHDAVRPGVVRVEGVQFLLQQCPQIPGLPHLVGIDVAPETATWIITPRFGARREMENDEIAAVHNWLRAVGKGEITP